MYSNQNKNEFMHFFAKISSLNFLLWPRPIKVDYVKKDWWRLALLQEHVKASCCHFACLSGLHCFSNFSLFFCRRELLTTSEATKTWTHRILQFLILWCHDPFRTHLLFFCTDSQLTPLGVAEARTLKLES